MTFFKPPHKFITTLGKCFPALKYSPKLCRVGQVVQSLMIVSRFWYNIKLTVRTKKLCVSYVEAVPCFVNFTNFGSMELLTYSICRGVTSLSGFLSRNQFLILGFEWSFSSMNLSDGRVRRSLSCI